ncbi:hypothetical protein [Priestia koreensis]|uniref:hypothetical protein n=1 Tax=Priestia koreensis TaxID=284581 RepID=UPI0020412CAC|nr:hypothetical protein [Priestia koreensis]MCM3005841.1 hypothetical protein [Priestia koreensis]
MITVSQLIEEILDNAKNGNDEVVFRDSNTDRSIEWDYADSFTKNGKNVVTMSINLAVFEEIIDDLNGQISEWQTKYNKLSEIVASNDKFLMVKDSELD